MEEVVRLRGKVIELIFHSRRIQGGPLARVG
jgi:hypothetical protein